MSRFRDIKRQARRDLHREMRVPALYISETGSPGVLVHVRIHTKFNALGDQKGTNFNSAEMIERQPQIVFMRDEVSAPQRGAVVSVEAGEAYRIANVSPPDDISVSADVVPMMAKETIGLPLPGEV